MEGEWEGRAGANLEHNRLGRQGTGGRLGGIGVEREGLSLGWDTAEGKGLNVTKEKLASAMWFYMTHRMG